MLHQERDHLVRRRNSSQSPPCSLGYTIPSNSTELR
jgi:hypothetical protein